MDDRLVKERRIEKIYKTDLTKNKFTKINLNNRKFSNVFYTTIYFGAKSKQWDGVQSLSSLKCGIRLRFYNDDSKSNIFVVDENKSCNCEFKTHKKKGFLNSKIYVHDDKGINYSKFCRYLDWLTKKDGKEEEFLELQLITNAFKPLVEQYELTEIMPIGAVNYERFRCSYGDYRMTLDFDVKFYIACEKDENLIMKLHRVDKYAIAEIKGDFAGDESEIEKEIFGEIGCKWENTKQTKAKIIKNLLEEYSVYFYEPELLEKSKYDWEITEREIKLDAEDNPKKYTDLFLKKMKETDYVIGAPRTNINYQYAYDVGDTGIICMAKDLFGTNKVIKYKKTIGYDVDSGTLIRYEYVEPFSEEAVKKACNVVLGKYVKKLKQSPVFCRDRLLIDVINPETCNVFEIYADHSYFLKDKTKNDFYQVEIEFAGVIMNNKEKILVNDDFVKKIDDDFLHLSKVIPRCYNDVGCRLTKSTRTKFEWVKKECF